MIDLSFLTDAEQEAILKVLQRDAELKKAEEQRVRHLQDEVNDENELKYKSGQWFYDAKSKRHRDKIHGADLVRASIRKRKNPTTLAELSQSGKDKSKRRWVNSINQDLFIPPELYGVMESPDETEEDLKLSMAETNQSAKRLNVASKDTDKGVMKNGTASPAKQRKNPFNSEGSVDEIDLSNGMPDQSLGGDQVNGQVGKKSDIMSSIKKLGVKLPYPSPVGSRRSSQEAKEDSLSQQPPVPKPRKLLINGQPPDRSNSSLQREDSFNNTNKPKGILKRRSSSSSTDSESIRISQTIEPIKLVLPASPILEAEQTNLFDDQITSSENSPDRQKQVRFSENVHQKPPTPNPESYNLREIGEFGILEPVSYQNELDAEFVDHPLEESRPNRYPYSDVDYDNSTEVLNQLSSLQQNRALTLQTHPNSKALDIEKKQEDQSKRIHNGISEILHESYPELNIDSAGTEPLYAVVKKPTSSDQEKDIDVDDSLVEPILLGQREKTVNQSEKPLEFGKSYGGVGKVNYVSDNPTSQPGKVYVPKNEDFMTPDRATDVQSSYDFVDEPKTRTQDIDYIKKWKHPYASEKEDFGAVQEFPNVNFGEGADGSVKSYPEYGTKSRYSPKEYKIDTKYKSVALRNTPDIDGRQVIPASKFPEAQNLPSSSRPVSGDFQTREMFLRENRGKIDLPKSANFKVMSMKDRIHDMPREQMPNPSQFQSLKHFWNVEDKNQSKEDLDTSPQRILTDVLKRNKPTRADLKPRNSKESPIDDHSLPSSFDSLSEEEQTSHKVASWLARSPAVYGTEQVDASEDQVHSGEEVMESVEKTMVDRKSQAEDFSSALQKLTEEASQVPKITNTERLKSEPIQIYPVAEPASFEKKKTSILVNSAEKKHPAIGFYERVAQISSTQSPAKQTKIVDVPAVGTEQYPKEVEESVERAVAPAKTANEFKIAFQKLMEEDQSSKSDDENQVEESNLQSGKQPLVEEHEIIERSSVPKGNDHQEFVSALKKLEIEASTPLNVADQDEQLESVSPPKSVSPVMSANFQKLMSEEQPMNETQEIIEKSSVPKGNDQQEFISALKKLEIEASTPLDVEDQKELPEIVSPPKTVSPVKSAFKIGFEHMTPTEDVLESTQKVNVAYPIQSSPTYRKDRNEFEEVVERSTAHNRTDEGDLSASPKKQDDEAAVSDPSLELEETYEKPKMTPTLQSTMLISTVQNVESPSFDVKTIPSSSVENQSYLEDPYSMRNSKSKEEAEDTYVIPEREMPKYTYDGEGKLPVEEETVEKTIVNMEESSADYRRRLTQLEEEATIPEEPEDLSFSEKFHVSQAPMKEVFVSKKVFPSSESMPTVLPSSRGIPKDLSQPQPYAYQELANYPPSPSDQSGSFTGSAGNVLYKKPDTSELSNSKKGKPALAGSPNYSNSSRHDKYTFEGMKAQDESISKVLDWFSRSSDSVDDPSPSVGQLEETKTRNYPDKTEESSGPSVDESEAKLKMRAIPKMSEISEPKEDIKNTGPDQPKILNMTAMEDESLPPQQVPLPDLLEFGKSGSGCGKIQSRSINDYSFEKDPQIPVEVAFEEDKESSEGEKEESNILKDTTPSLGIGDTGPMEAGNNKEENNVLEDTMPSLGIGDTGPMEVGKNKEENVLEDTMPSLGKGDTGPMEVGMNKEENNVLADTMPSLGISDTGPMEVGKNKEENNVLEDTMPSLGIGDTGPMEVGKNKEESNVLEDTMPSLGIGDTGPMENADSDQPKILNMTAIEDESLPPQQVPLPDFLEFGKSGSGCGKIQSRSIKDDSFQKDPQIPVEVAFEEDKESLEGEKEESNVLKDTNPSLGKGDTGPMEAGNDNEESNVLEEAMPLGIGDTGPTEVGKNKENNLLEDTMPSLGISDTGPMEVGKNKEESNVLEDTMPSLGIGDTGPMENADSDQPKILNMTAIEDESLPPQQVPLPDFLEFGKSGSGCGKIQSRSIKDDSFQKDPQIPVEVAFEEDKESLEGEKEESNVLKDTTPSLGISDTGAVEVDKNKDQEVITLEQSEDQSSRKQKDGSVVPPKRVSDIKLLWEGDRPSQDTAKKPTLISIKPTSVDLSITPKSSSFDSDDHNGASLVTFKKVMVEDEEDSMPPVDQLKSYWENEKNKNKTNNRQSMSNGSQSDDKGVHLVDLRSKFKKRHTFHDFFEKEKSTNLEKNPPGRSVSLSESANEGLKDRIKSASFQNLKNFWNTSSKSDDKPTSQALPDKMNKQFGSNPDIRSKEPVGWRLKGRLAAKSLQDIREDPSVYGAQPMSRKFSKGSSGEDDPLNSVINPINNSVENSKLEKPIGSVDITAQESSGTSNYPKFSHALFDESETKQHPEIPAEKQAALAEITEPSVAPNRIAKSELSLRLKKTLQGEVSGKNFSLPEERPHSMTFENGSADHNVYRDKENGEMNEMGRKLLLVKQSGLDVDSPVSSNGTVLLQENEYPTGEASDLGEAVNESIEKTVLKKDPSDLGKKLQNLYNESLNAVDMQHGNLSQLEYMDINEPDQNFSKVLAVSSGNMSKNIQSSEPIIVNISSKKTQIGNDLPIEPGQLEQAEISSSKVVNTTFEKPISELREPVENELSSKPNVYKDNVLHPEERSRKEIIERIEMPTVLPKKRFSDFDEKLRQLYEESQNSQPDLAEVSDSGNIAENESAGVNNKANVYLYLSEPKKTFLKSSTVYLESSQPVSADRETVTDESALSQDMSVQEVNETIEKTVAPTRISTAKSLEELQKEALNEEEGAFLGNVSSGHVALNESHPELNEPAMRESSVSEDTVEEGTKLARYEEPQEGTPETFLSNRQSTPVKDKNSSLRKSTLELYLEAPYRRELSKSIDFDISQYVTSDVDKYQSKPNSQKGDTLGPIENSFPENAEKFKRMSQSVPTFLQDDTDGRDTDSASESSFQIGRHKKSPSSLTNLSGSSGMASMSSVSGSVMSMYSGDFGNVDIKGGIEFSIDYVEQLKEFHIYIYQCKDLAAAEVKKQRSDPYVKAYLLPEKAKMGKRKSAVKKKTLNPVYNEILRYKIPKESLETQTLNLSVWHHDVLGRNSFLGEVNLNLATWDWNNTQRNWYQLEARTPASGIGLENRGEMKLSLMYIPMSPPEVSKKPTKTGEVHIMIRECIQLPMLRENKINSFVKCTILPDTSRKSRQKTRTVDKTPNPIFNHTMVYDGFKEEDLREACVELTVWDHNKLSNHFLGGIRIGLGTGKSYGTAVDWMDSSPEESTMWEKMIASPNTWIEGMLPLRMFKMAKLNK
ncbi:synaptotagmin-like protein 2 isoform X3 [Hyla sarda]|uniref:synaptotagmin-like protein 2 isoform X3 n=1 Tax=Hyla sarda TaxID=327740 RepID=UPI0024C261E7|nr:synaptotagmin-like protein 2 isoform X3 [Hyla sarda]